MRPFNYVNPTRILFGKGQIESLSQEVPSGARVLLVAGGGSIRKNGVYEQVKAALGDRLVEEHFGVKPNPDVADLVPIIARVREQRLDFLLAVGGGSVCDAAKFVAAAAPSNAEPWSLVARGMRVSEALPVGVVLTLPGTGSEANSTGAISNRETAQKLVFSHPLCFPRFAVLDPETTYSLPARQVGNGVVDAFVHTLEQYLTYPAGGAMQDRLAEAILATLCDHGPRALLTPEDYDVRANVMWAATLALNGLIGQGVPQDWTSHHIGHELTALYGIDHAPSLAVALPAVLTARRNEKLEKLCQYGERIFGITEGPRDERAQRAIEETVRFFEGLGLPTRLSSHGIGAEAIPKVIANLKAARRLRMGERLDITPDLAGRMLELAL